MELIVVSIGTLSKNPLWNERIATRTSHATTTLIRTQAPEKTGKEMLVLTDPSLPGDVLDGRLYERAGIRAADITHIFLTNWRPVHRRGLERFSKATWWMHEAEIEAANDALNHAHEQALRHGTAAMDSLIEKERALLDKLTAAPDELGQAVQIYPLPGYTPGQCGLIVTEPTLTTVVTGDAVATAGHFAAGQVLPDCWDLEKAKESLLDLFQVADVIVPGHDNLFIAPRSAGL
jgi:glyoxylase-like metal-dependent hydrolase (beta-lactamase superfamily II)